MENRIFTIMLSFLLVFSLYRNTLQDEKYEKRYQDKSFPNYTLVYNKTVSCGKHEVGLFPAQTWTCADIRVDGLRLAYGLYPGLGVDNMCTETKGFDDITELCLVMMESIDAKKTLWAALVTNATCDHLDENRVLLNRTIKEDGMLDDVTYVWDLMGPGHGWIHTIQCMAVQDRKPDRVTHSSHTHTEL